MARYRDLEPAKSPRLRISSTKHIKRGRWAEAGRRSTKADATTNTSSIVQLCTAIPPAPRRCRFSVCASSRHCSLINEHNKRYRIDMNCRFPGAAQPSHCPLGAEDISATIASSPKRAPWAGCTNIISVSMHPDMSPLLVCDPAYEQLMRNERR